MKQKSILCRYVKFAFIFDFVAPLEFCLSSVIFTIELPRTDLFGSLLVDLYVLFNVFYKGFFWSNMKYCRFHFIKETNYYRLCNTWFNFAELFRKSGCFAPLSKTGSTKGFCIYVKLLNEMRSGNRDSYC